MPSLEPQIMLSLCVPTHDGRREFLRQLIESILEQMADINSSLVEICISDNGSQDGTQAMISSYQEHGLPIRLTYFRFAKNEGLANFENIFEMASGQYCWMIGSDDILPPGSLGRILEIIQDHNDVAGITVNKLNFNVNYTELAGLDHETVMISNPEISRTIEGFDDIIQELIFLFCFISANIIKKDAWHKALNEVGREKFYDTRHFAFSGVLIEIARQSPRWLWISEFLVTQRLGNISLAQELGQLSFGLQVTEDIFGYLKFAVSDDNISKSTKKRLLQCPFLLYWNPFEVIKYKVENPWNIASWWDMLTHCTRWFWRLTVFHFTTFPLLLMPNFLCLPLKGAFEAPILRDSSKPAGSFRRLLSWLSRTNRHSGLPAWVGIVIHRFPVSLIWSFLWPQNSTSYRTSNGFGFAC